MPGRNRTRWDKGPCGRCGVPAYAEFCTDCRQTDPLVAKGGRSARAMRDVRIREARWWRELTTEIERVADPTAAQRRARRGTRQAAWFVVHEPCTNRPTRRSRP